MFGTAIRVFGYKTRHTTHPAGGARLCLEGKGRGGADERKQAQSYQSTLPHGEKSRQPLSRALSSPSSPSVLCTYLSLCHLGAACKQARRSSLRPSRPPSCPERHPRRPKRRASGCFPAPPTRPPPADRPTIEKKRRKKEKTGTDQATACLISRGRFFPSSAHEGNTETSSQLKALFPDEFTTIPDLQGGNIIHRTPRQILNSNRARFPQPPSLRRARTTQATIDLPPRLPPPTTILR